MGAYTKEIARRIDAPVIDGVQAAVTLAESLVRARTDHQQAGRIRPPLPKPYTGLLTGFMIK